MYKENFHSHTYYCDGKNSPAEMAQGALNLGFHALGFSGHAFIKNFECDWCMTPDDTSKYITDINKLKSVYAGKMQIYCGTELDYFCTDVPGEYDYTIGSVHYLNMCGKYQAIDSSLKEQQEAADKFFGGSLVEYAVEYYSLVADLMNKLNTPDIIGHFDLVSKFNEADCAFNTLDKRYTEAWHNAVDALLPYNKPFEINTGAIARGCRITPYPALDIADYIHSKGGYFIITSDCHNVNYLDFGFDDVERVYAKYNIIKFSEYLKNRQ